MCALVFIFIFLHSSFVFFRFFFSYCNADAGPLLEFVKFISVHEWGKIDMKDIWKCWQMAFGSKLFLFAWIFVVIELLRFCCYWNFGTRWHFVQFTSNVLLFFFSSQPNPFVFLDWVFGSIIRGAFIMFSHFICLSAHDVRWLFGWKMVLYTNW